VTRGRLTHFGSPRGKAPVKMDTKFHSARPRDEIGILEIGKCASPFGVSHLGSSVGVWRNDERRKSSRKIRANLTSGILMDDGELFFSIIH